MGAHTELQSCPCGRWWPCRALRWPVPAPGGPGSVARGLSRLSKTISPGLNCITLRTGNIPWGCAAYFISVLRAGACGSPRASGTGMGFACSTNPAALLPGAAARGCSPVAGRGAACPNQPWHGRCIARPLPRAVEWLLLRLSPPAPVSTCAHFFLHQHLLKASPSAVLTHPSQRAMYRLQHHFTRANSCRLPRPSAPLCRHSAPGLSLRPRFSPVLAAPVAVAFVGHRQRMRSQHLGLPLGWPLAPQVGVNPHQLPLRTPGPSSHSSAESARVDRALCGLTPAPAAPQPSGKRHIDARCRLRL